MKYVGSEVSDQQQSPRKVTDYDYDTAQAFLNIANIDQSSAKEVLANVMASYRENQQALGIFIEGAPIT